MDRTNALREAVEAGNPVYGAGTATFSPTMVEVYGGLGMDFVWLDFEHAGPSPWDSTVFEDLTRAAEVSDTELLVRLPGTDPHLVRKVLDAGVRTILLPRVETAAEVREACEAARFAYGGGVGDRGVATARTGAWAGDRTDHARREDENVLVGAMVENTHAVENLAEILAVEGLGFVFVGPSDLSASLGRTLDTDHPEVRERVERVEATVADSDVALGGTAKDEGSVAEALDAGYDIVRLGGDLGAIRGHFGGLLERIDAA
jgi:2-dehydro-3-deoxyglucarate aldolase